MYSSIVWCGVGLMYEVVRRGERERAKEKCEEGKEEKRRKKKKQRSGS